MPDMEKVAAVRAMADSLHRIAPPGRAPMAAELYDLGWRLHPELATKELVRMGPASMGNWAPQAAQKINLKARREAALDPRFLLDLLRQSKAADLVALADEVEAAIGDPEKTAATLARIRKQFPDVVATAAQLADKYAAEVAAEDAEAAAAEAASSE